MSEQFWVYINEPNNKALIHEAQCSFCNNGQGMDKASSACNGAWFGPYNLQTAENQATESGKKNVRWCGHCARKFNIETRLTKRDSQ